MADIEQPVQPTPPQSPYGVPMVATSASGAQLMTAVTVAQAQFLLKLASLDAATIRDLMIAMGFVGSLIPVGFTSLLPYCLLPNGQNVSRSTYSLLFGKWGTTFGVGDGNTTFGLLDIRGRTIFGHDPGNASGRLTNPTGGAQGINGSVIGNAGGEQAHTQTLAELIAHNHLPSSGPSFVTNQGTAFVLGAGAPRGVDSIANTGGSAAFNVVPPGVVLNWMIFAGA